MRPGAIFDMDGLMFDTEKVWQKCWTILAEEMHLELDPQFRKDVCGSSGALMNRIIEKYYHVEDGQPIADRCRKMVHAFLEEDVPEKPGIHEMLEFLKANGVKIAVASSSRREMIEANLVKTGCREYIDEVLSGTEFEHGKPAPDLFLGAAAALGLPAEECYVFEDAYNGVRAGHASGAATIMIPDTQEPTEEMEQLAAVICPSLLDAIEVLKSGKI